MNNNTFDRRMQLGASRRRREDAEALHESKRWAGAIYVGGYAVECALKSLVCYLEREDDFRQTSLVRAGMSGNSLHNLARLLSGAPGVQSAIALDRTNKYKEAWETITVLWEKDQLRYWDKVGNELQSERFISAVQRFHRFLLTQQGEAS